MSLALKRPSYHYHRPLMDCYSKFYYYHTQESPSIEKHQIVNKNVHLKYTQPESFKHKTFKQYIQSMKNRFCYRNLVCNAFFPQNYPNSVFAQYTPFIKWLFLQNIMGSAICVLSTQSLLLSIGVGASDSLKVAATFQWVIKDALGQIGGILAAGMLGNYAFKLEGRKFDLQTKKLRFLAVLGLAAASLIEISTLLRPSSFLILASFANLGFITLLTGLVKNICWVSSSATRASLLRAFSKEENLGDLTAKHASQGTAASLVGTGIGLCVSHLFSLSTFSDFFFAYLPFSCGLFIGLCQTTRNMRNCNLNYQLLATIFSHFKSNVSSNEQDPKILLRQLSSLRLISPDTLNSNEPSEIKEILINYPLYTISSDDWISDADAFLLSLNRNNDTCLWIKKNSTDVQIVKAVLYALIFNAWKMKPTDVPNIVKLFIDKLERESLWNLDSFAILSPEITSRPMIIKLN